MTDFKRMAVFAAVVELGSMSGAARRLGMSTSAVSQHLRALEQSFGVTLLHRSTRKLTLTDAGQRFAEHCQAMVAAAERARQQLHMTRDAPVGQLRMSAPVGFARHIGPALAPLLASNPGLDLHLVVADELIDLIDARIDLALRGGRLPDSSWVARRLCTLGMVLCATPAYLALRGTPRVPTDLLSHQCLGLPRGEAGLEIMLGHPDGRSEQLRLQPRVTSNNQLSLQQMCLAGLGITLSPRPDVEEDLRSGRLAVVLPDWQLPGISTWAVTPRRDAQPAKVRYAIDAMQAYLSGMPGSTG